MAVTLRKPLNLASGQVLTPAPGVALNWSAGKGGFTPTGFKVYRSTTSVVNVSVIGNAIGTVAFTTPSATYSYTDTTGTAGVTYWYKVTSYNLSAVPTQSDPSSAVTGIKPASAVDVTAPTKPGTPTLDSKTNTTIAATTTGSTDAVGVTGYRWKLDGAQVGATALALSKTFTGLTGGTAYSVTVDAIDAAGNVSLISDALAVTTYTTAIPVWPGTIPTQTIPKDVAYSGFTLQASDPDSPSLTYTIVSGSVTGLSLVGALYSGTPTVAGQQTVTFRASDGYNTADKAIVFNVLNPDTTDPTVPPSFAANRVTGSETTLSLVWGASTDPVVAGAITAGLAGYTIRRPGVVITKLPTATTHTDTGLTAGTTYNYTIEAFDAATIPNVSGTRAASGTTDTVVTPETFNWYVSPTGTAGAAGTQANPKSLQAGISAATAGQSIGCLAGTYALTAVIVPSTASNTTLKAVTGASVTWTTNQQSRFITASGSGHTWGEGITLNGTNTAEGQYATSKPDAGIVYTGADWQFKFAMTNMKNDFVRVQGQRARFNGANFYHCGALNRGDGNDAGNGLRGEAQAVDCLVEDTRAATGGHDSVQFGTGGKMLIRTSLFTNNWAAFGGPGTGARIASFTYSNGLPAAGGSSSRFVMEDTCLHSSYPPQDSGSDAPGVKFMLNNTLWRRLFLLNCQGLEAALACLSPGVVADGADPGASDQRYTNFTIWDAPDGAFGLTDNNGVKFGPFEFKNGIVANVASAVSNRAIVLKYRSKNAAGVAYPATRGNWRNLIFFENMIFDADYDVRIQDLAGVDPTITKPLSQMVTDYPAGGGFRQNFKNITIVDPAFFNAAIPASTVPATALTQCRSNFLPGAAEALGAGTYLTQVNGAKVGQTTFTVDDAKWFRDKMGWAHLTGDTIYIEGVGVKQITLIAGNNITVAGAAFNVADNAKIWLGSSATPNIGAV